MSTAPAHTESAGSAARIFVARSPIVDRASRVYGYELLVRPPSGMAANEPPEERASARALADALLAIGLDALTDGRQAFLSVGRQLVLEGLPEVLPSARVVIEVGTALHAHADAIAACQALRKTGYKIAIDDFVPGPTTADLLPLADYLKVAVTSPTVKMVRGLFGPNRGPLLIAKGVDSVAQFSEAALAGFTHFQGYFFGRPVVSQGRAVVGSRLQNLQLLRALDNENLSVHHLEELVKHDAALVHRILRTVNSAGYGLRGTIKSIRDALVILGRNTIRRWVVLWSIAGLNDTAPQELIVMSCVRARFCELLAVRMNHLDEAGEGFLVGMCSLLDAILEQPMAQVLQALPLEDDTKAALLGEQNEMRRLIDCAVAYERGDWETCDRIVHTLGLSPDALPAIYADSLKWTRELRQYA